MSETKTLELPAGFLTKIADSELAFLQTDKMVVKGNEYEVDFETMERDNRLWVAARARVGRLYVAVTPWQDTENPYLSAVFALRTNLEASSNISCRSRDFLKPQAGEIARLMLGGGEVCQTIIVKTTEEGVITAEPSDKFLPRFDENGQIIVEDAYFRRIPAEKFKNSGFYDCQKFWKYQFNDSPGTQKIEFFLSKTVWMVES